MGESLLDIVASGKMTADEAIAARKKPVKPKPMRGGDAELQAAAEGGFSPSSSPIEKPKPKSMLDAVADGDLTADEAIETYRQPTAGERVKITANTALESFADPLSKTVKGIGRVVNAGQDALRKLDDPLSMSTPYEDQETIAGNVSGDLGQVAQEAQARIPPQAENQGYLWKTATQTIPGVVGSLGAAMVTGPTPTALALNVGFANAEKMYEEADAKGADPAHKWLAFASGGGVGALSTVAFAGALSKAEAAGGSKFVNTIKSIVRSGAHPDPRVGMAANAALAKLGENLAAKGIYDEDRPVFEGVLKSGEQGLWGAFATGVVHGLVARQVEGMTAEPKPAEKVQEKPAEAAKAKPETEASILKELEAFTKQVDTENAQREAAAPTVEPVAPTADVARTKGYEEPAQDVPAVMPKGEQIGTDLTGEPVFSKQERGDLKRPDEGLVKPTAKTPDMFEDHDGMFADQAVEKDSGVKAPAKTYEEFAKEYRTAFKESNKYKPSEIGSRVFTDKMAELADAHPEYLTRLEAEEDAAPRAAKKPAPVSPKRRPDQLPGDLAGAKPRFNLGKESFEPKFESDIDKALFITSQKTPSKRDADYRAFLEKQGYTAADIEAHGQTVRSALKSHLSGDANQAPLPRTSSLAPVKAEPIVAPKAKKPLPIKPKKPRAEQQKQAATEGTSFRDFVRTQGGLKFRDDFQEFTAKQLGDKPFAKPIVRSAKTKGGSEADIMLERAIEQGWFPGRDRADIHVDDLIDFIRRDAPHPSREGEVAARFEDEALADQQRQQDEQLAISDEEIDAQALREAETPDKIAEINKRIEKAVAEFNDITRNTPFSNPALNPKIIAKVAEVAGLHVKKGVLKFEDFASKAVEQFGEKIRPYLHEAWAKVGESLPPKEREKLAAPTEVPPSPFQITDMTWLQRQRKRVEDKFIRVRDVQKQIQSQGGKVGDESNVDVAEDVFSSRAADATKRIVDTYQEPALKQLAKGDIPLNKGTPEKPGIREFFTARQGVHRNATLEGRTEGKKLSGSGMSDMEAHAVMEAVRNSPQREQYEEIGRLNDEMQREKLALDVAAGITSPEQAAQYVKDFGENYSPLMTEDGDPDAPSFIAGGRSLQVKGKLYKQAKGRESLADNPLISSLAQTQAHAVLREKNRVGQTLAALVRENPNPELWEIYSATKDIPHQDMLDGNVFTYKEGGKDMHIAIRDKEFAMAMKGLDEAQVGPVIQKLGQFARFYKQLHTTWKLSFASSNWQKDLGLAGIKLSAEESAGMAKRVLKRALPMAKAAWDVTRNPNAPGKNQDLVREAKREGGVVGWIEPKDFQKTLKEFEGRLAELKGDRPLRSGFRKLRKLVEDANAAVEHSTRVSVYAELRVSGKSPQQAAKGALHVTVPFTRRGEWGPTMNALYLFSGANVQGTAGLIRSLKGPRGRKIAAGAIAAGFLNSAYNRAMSGTDEKSGRNIWDEMPDSDKESNFRMMSPTGSGNSFGARLPWGVSALFRMGGIAEETLFGDRTVGKAATATLLALFRNFSPLTGSTPAQLVTPWIARPSIEQIENRNYSNTPIHPERNPFEKPPAPAHTIATKNASALTKAITKWVSDNTGGNSVRGGLIDFYPDNVEHAIGAVVGGAGQDLLRTYSAVEKMVTGEKLPFRSIPVFNNFVSEPPENAFKGVYYDRAKQFEIIKDEIKAGEPLSASEEKLRPAIGPFFFAEKRIDKLRKVLKATNDPAEKKRLQDMIDDAMQVMNRKVQELQTK